MTFGRDAAFGYRDWIPPHDQRWPLPSLVTASGISLDIAMERASAGAITAHPRQQGDGRLGRYWRGPASLRQDRNDISPSYAAANSDQPLSQFQRDHRGERERNDDEETPAFH
jgi:hypothetical protein